MFVDVSVTVSVKRGMPVWSVRANVVCSCQCGLFMAAAVHVSDGILNFVLEYLLIEL